MQMGAGNERRVEKDRMASEISEKQPLAVMNLDERVASQVQIEVRKKSQLRTQLCHNAFAALTGHHGTRQP